jgi:hypothetical protein
LACNNPLGKKVEQAQPPREGFLLSLGGVRARRLKSQEAMKDLFAGRWRMVLDQVAVSAVLGTTELLAGFEKSLFHDKPAAWWVSAADRIAAHHPEAGILGAPFWLTADSRAIARRKEGETSRPIVFGDAASRFALEWKLLDRLHDAYGKTPAGERARDWLVKHAAYTIAPDAEVELAAFAESFENAPLDVSDEDLRELRDRFDPMSDRRAEALGRRVGEALLLDGFAFKSGKKAYLSRTLTSQTFSFVLRTDAHPTRGKNLNTRAFRCNRCAEQKRSNFFRVKT